jgi:hypothetical protein
MMTGHRYSWCGSGAFRLLGAGDRRTAGTGDLWQHDVLPRGPGDRGQSRTVYGPFSVFGVLILSLLYCPLYTVPLVLSLLYRASYTVPLTCSSYTAPRTRTPASQRCSGPAPIGHWCHQVQHWCHQEQGGTRCRDLYCQPLAADLYCQPPADDILSLCFQRCSGRAKYSDSTVVSLITGRKTQWDTSFFRLFFPCQQYCPCLPLTNE